jgi:hypothetical protein
VYIGAWRSLVAHSAGGRAVAGSNPVAPTKSVAPSGCYKSRHASKKWHSIAVLRQSSGHGISSTSQPGLPFTSRKGVAR